MLKFYPSWLIFSLVLILGVFFVTSSDNWFSAWIGFELSLLGFLPMFSGNKIVVEGMIKYFLVQVGGSSLFLVSFIPSISWLKDTTFILAMLMKLGVFPFYQWVPLVMSSLSWVGCFLLCTIQKINPLIMLITNSNAWPAILVASSLSILVSGLLGYNQTYMRALMGYSAIAHSGWLLCMGTFSYSFMAGYFMVYCYLLFFLFLDFNKSHLLKTTSSSKSTKEKFKTSLILLTLSGMPPFSMFFFKLVALFYLSVFPLVCLPLLLGSYLCIYYYISLVLPSTIKFWSNSQSYDWPKSKINTLMVISLMPFIFLF